MGNYAYFRKIETNGNLLIFCQTTTNTSVQKWRHTSWTEFAVKSQFYS